LTWTRITDQDEAADLLPAWLGRRLIGQHGRFGLLLATGGVMRITSIGAVNMSSDCLALLDVSLDYGGMPDGIDGAWQPKQFLGAPVAGATAATVNLAHVTAAVEFIDTVLVEPPSESDTVTAAEVVAELGRVTAEVSGPE
jgi:hypothetical protein